MQMRLKKLHDESVDSKADKKHPVHFQMYNQLIAVFLGLLPKKGKVGGYLQLGR
jgi:hypothetical protein